MIAAAQQLRREIREGSQNDGTGVPRRRSTHAVQAVGAYPQQVVVKVFRSCPRREAHREWAFLQLAEQRGHHLAPSPIWCDLDHELPAVAMTRVPGSPLGETPLSGEQVVALAQLLQDLYALVPPPPRQASHEQVVLEAIRERWLDADRGWPPMVQTAHRVAADWLALRELDTLPPPSTIVMGRGDCNLANFLWAEEDQSHAGRGITPRPYGTTEPVHVPSTATLPRGGGGGPRMFHVDFEDSGARALASELADLVEHLESRRTRESVWADLVSEFALNQRDRAWHKACRRLFGVMWLMLLLPGAPASTRNPPGTLERQAERVLALTG
jgi:hypothetical protein